MERAPLPSSHAAHPAAADDRSIAPMPRPRSACERAPRQPRYAWLPRPVPRATPPSEGKQLTALSISQCSSAAGLAEFAAQTPSVFWNISSKEWKELGGAKLWEDRVVHQRHHNGSYNELIEGLTRPKAQGNPSLGLGSRGQRVDRAAFIRIDESDGEGSGEANVG